jgi:hypothetical protein
MITNLTAVPSLLSLLLLLLLFHDTEIFAERTNVDLKDKYKIIKKNASKAALL